MLHLALALLAQAPPPAVVEKPTVVVLDNRAVKDQAPAAMLARVNEELERRRGVRVVLMSDARKHLDARAAKELAACVDEAGCLAAATREMGGDVVVTVRLTRREGAYFLALTRVSALRPQITDDAAILAGTDADAIAAIPEKVGDLFPGETLPPHPGARDARDAPAP